MVFKNPEDRNLFGQAVDAKQDGFTLGQIVMIFPMIPWYVLVMVAKVGAAPFKLISTLRRGGPNTVNNYSTYGDKDGRGGGRIKRTRHGGAE